MQKVAIAVDKIRAAGKIVGTLATLEEMPHWRKRGVQFFYSIPILSCAAVREALA